MGSLVRSGRYQHMVHSIGTARGDITDVKDIRNSIGSEAGAGVGESYPIALAVLVQIGRTVGAIYLPEAKGGIRDIYRVGTKGRRGSISHQVNAELFATGTRGSGRGQGVHSIRPVGGWWRGVHDTVAVCQVGLDRERGCGCFGDIRLKCTEVNVGAADIDLNIGKAIGVETTLRLKVSTGGVADGGLAERLLGAKITGAGVEFATTPEEHFVHLIITRGGLPTGKRYGWNEQCDEWPQK